MPERREDDKKNGLQIKFSALPSYRQFSYGTLPGINKKAVPKRGLPNLKPSAFTTILKDYISTLSHAHWNRHHIHLQEFGRYQKNNQW